MRYTRPLRSRLAAVTLSALLAAGTASAADAHPNVPKWWQYNKVTWTKSWRAYPKYRREYRQWRHRHQYSSSDRSGSGQQWMQRKYRRDNFHRAISFQVGQATWYDAHGQSGACGKPLVGMYAASRTLPCGALVSVRAGGKYVLVTILDRGPFGSSNRILDLSPKAFSWLSPLGAGVIDVRATQLRR
jgi:rare lipoprotein A (peptidoglycan hydrolase)